MSVLSQNSEYEDCIDGRCYCQEGGMEVIPKFTINKVKLKHSGQNEGVKVK